ncbi:hypothetical protein UT300012_21490 [Paraclostridium bifermentans]
MDLDNFRKLVTETFEVLDYLETSNIVVDILPQFGVEVSLTDNNIDESEVLPLLLSRSEEQLRNILKCNTVALALLEDEYRLEELVISLNYSMYYDNLRTILSIVEKEDMDYLKVFYDEVYRIMPECFDYNRNTKKGYVVMEHILQDESKEGTVTSLVMGYVMTTIDSVFEVAKDWKLYNTSRIISKFPIEIDNDKYVHYAINIEV